MKQYIYRPEEANRNEWPSGTLRLNFDVTADPGKADVFVYPGALHEVSNPADLDRLPYMAGNESKHVFYHCGDHEVLYGKPCRFIRSNTRTWYFAQDPNTISWPWPVEQYAECMEVPTDGFKYDLSFHGWNWSDVRKQSVASCLEQKELLFDVATYSDFTGYIYDKPEGIRRRKEFRRSMRESVLALCPESIPGVFPYRFFEAMSAARVPVLVGSDYVLPFRDEIPYELFTLFIPRDNATQTGERITDLLSRKSYSELIDMGQLARQMWAQWLNTRDDGVRLMTYAVEKALQ
jgi:hypothetical protein